MQDLPIKRMLRPKQVAEKVGAGVSTIRAWVTQNKFPPPIEISKRFKVWNESEIDTWLEQQPRREVSNGTR
jgi:predicted DNA-binding transcriptional regulator AlpA